MILCLTACVHSDPWTTKDTIGQVLVTTTIVADAITTSRIQYTPYVIEKDKVARLVLGTSPSTSDTYLYFSTLAISSYFISRALPSKWRPYWQGYEVLKYGYAVNNNCGWDLC